jgi:hypothetical protein
MNEEHSSRLLFTCQVHFSIGKKYICDFLFQTKLFKKFHKQLPPKSKRNKKLSQLFQKLQKLKEMSKYKRSAPLKVSPILAEIQQPESSKE